MRITSPAFTSGNQIPPQYTCDGIDINPEIKIDGVPEYAKSLALVMDDPDAPSGVFVHWLAWNIPPDTKVIREHSPAPGSVEGRTSFGKSSWGGPCPPNGPHRYYFHFYALDTTINLTSTAGRNELDRAMDGHIIDTGELMGTYTREVIP